VDGSIHTPSYRAYSSFLSALSKKDSVKYVPDQPIALSHVVCIPHHSKTKSGHQPA
jgi:hypothetical protein